MKPQLLSMGLALLILLIFIIASVVNVWLLIERGPAPFTVIPVAAFLVATVGWLFVITRIRKG